MARLSEHYFAEDAEPVSERERLDMLAGFYGPWTQDWLARRAGLQPGMAVLEAGAGSGAMLRWFAQVVGPQGDVLGLDRTLAHMGERPPPVRLMEADLYDLPAEPARFDLVYARLVLEHLPDPDTALTQLSKWLKPGGRLAIASLDFADVKAITGGEAGARFDAGIGHIQSAIRDTGLVDPAFGRTLKDRFERAGLTCVTEDVLERVSEGGSDWSRFLAANNRVIGAMIGADPAIVDSVCTLMDTSGFQYTDQKVYGVTGRRD